MLIVVGEEHRAGNVGKTLLEPAANAFEQWKGIPWENH